MRGPAVLAVLNEFDERAIDVWIGGGWGVDALVGRQTRDHGDLDVSIRAEDEPAVLEMLQALGFEIVTDWRPTRVALLHADRGEIDVHPIRFRSDGSAWLPGIDGQVFEYPADTFTTGTIMGATVNCIDAALQLAFHLGYPPQPKDRADMRALAAAGLIDLPEEYR